MSLRLVIPLRDMPAAYLTEHGMRKKCPTCARVLELSAFNKSKQTKDGLCGQCRECAARASSESRRKRVESGLPLRSQDYKDRANAARRLKYLVDPEKFRQRSRDNRRNNPEACNLSCLRSKDKNRKHYAEYAKNYYHKNAESLRPKRRERAMRRVLAEKRATPAWANQQSILEIYRLASEMSSSACIYHVDHIVPIRSKIVCGLHVESNLRVISSSANQAKGNRRWPGHPDEAMDLEENYDTFYLPKNHRATAEAGKFAEVD